MKKVIVLLLTGLLCAFSQDDVSQDEGRRAEVLFFGKENKTQHASWLATKLFKSGINLTYAEKLDNLEQYDGLIVNAALTPAQEQKVKAFVESGKGLVWLDVAGKSFKGRVFRAGKGADDNTWKTNAFLNTMRDSILWTLGDAVKQQIVAANIPDVDIYHSDTIADYTKRYLVPKMQEALQPAQSNKLTQIPVGFEMQLFAQEPDITKPIAMAWDERGRLWIVETVDYPNAFTEVDSVANDRIKICEDTDGDGKADKFTIFADSLNIPTSITFANGGVILAMAPHFLFLKDTNGDDKADVRQVMFTGWAKQDTHSGPSNLQYGFDNKIWGVVGYSGFNGTIDGKTQRFPQGVYHFKSDGTDFEFLGRTSNNTWGLGISEDNNVFISTANNTHSAYYSLPSWHMLRKVPGQPSVDPVEKIDGHYDVHAMTPNLRQVDVMGGFTSATGHHLYTARSFPKEYWNRIAFVCEPTVRLVHQAVIEPDGAGFKEKDGWNLLASSDEWFAPVQAQVGPDGAVWIADWYNFIIQHNVFVKEQAPRETVLPFTEQPHGKGNAFESKLRDSVHGRIYRIVYKDAKPYKPLKLSTRDVPGLVAALSNDNMFWRMHAQRLLVESKATSAIPALYNIINNQQVDEAGLNSPAVHALWTLHGLGTLNAASLQVVNKALKHPAAGVRKAALEVLPHDQKGIAAIAQSGVLNDRNLQTRLAAFRALADYPASSQAGALLYKATQTAQNRTDPWLARALFAAVITHEQGFLAVADPASPYVKALQQSTYALERGGMPLALDASGKEITIEALLNKRESRVLEGPIVAHGDKTNGYALFVAGDKLTMVVNQKGVAYTAATTEPLPDKMEIKAQLLKTGQMRITVNDATAATGKAPGLFPAPFAAAMVRAGEDMPEQQRVAGYAGRLRADVRNITLSLNKSGNEGAAAAIPSVVIDLKVVKDIMQYDKKRFTVKAGQNVTIRLENPDGMQHNLLIIKPGTLQIVGAAADAMVRDPKASQMQYVPKVPQVLHSTRLLNPGETVSLKFTAPKTPGEYPFVCTFPGHWRGMNGIMVVTK